MNPLKKEEWAKPVIENGSSKIIIRNYFHLPLYKRVKRVYNNIEEINRVSPLLKMILHGLFPHLISQSRAAVAHRAHNSEVVGSIPTSAPSCKVAPC